MRASLLDEFAIGDGNMRALSGHLPTRRLRNLPQRIELFRDGRLAAKAT
jgi:hypothetical protein